VLPLSVGHLAEYRSRIHRTYSGACSLSTFAGKYYCIDSGSSIRCRPHICPVIPGNASYFLDSQTLRSFPDSTLAVPRSRRVIQSRLSSIPYQTLRILSTKNEFSLYQSLFWMLEKYSIFSSLVFFSRWSLIVDSPLSLLF